ncbi:MAG TPA: hypothetical protein VM694_08360 [Polyangium sp.]|nr:hypothetical protein [Polyangium sp.]
MKVYRVIKVDKKGRLAWNDGSQNAPDPIVVCHKIKWKPEKMLQKFWGFWL